MAITLGLVEAVDDDGVYVSMPGSRGVLRGPYESTAQVVAGERVLLTTTDSGEVVVGGVVGDGQGVSVKAFGAKGDGVTDDTDAIQAAVNAAAGSSTVLFPTGVYEITSAITVPAGSSLLGSSAATIHQTTAAVNGLEVTGSDVTIEGLTLRGRHTTATAYGTGDAERAISAVGTSTSSRIENVTITGCTMELWGMYGVFLEFVTCFNVADCTVSDIGRGGIACLSVSGGTIVGNVVDTVLNTIGGNGYGIILTRRTDVGELDTHPRSCDVLVHGNTVRNVTGWEGLDTHAGENITFSHNIVTGCYMGISATKCKNVSNVYTYSPLNVSIVNNFVDSQVDDGSASSGIVFVGADDEYGTGIISGNTVRRHGPSTNWNSGGIVCYWTRGLVVSGNTLDQSSPHGVSMYHHNDGFAVVDNTFIDNWTDSAGASPACALALTSHPNVGVFAGNVLRDGDKSATYLNEVGLRDDGGSANGTRVEYAANEMQAVTGVVLSTGAAGGVVTSVNPASSLLGFYGTAPAAKPTVTGSTGGNAALQSLLSALSNLGLITDSTT